MKDKLIKELKNIPDLPTNVIELDKFRKEDNIDTDKLIILILVVTFPPRLYENPGLNLRSFLIS